MPWSRSHDAEAIVAPVLFGRGGPAVFTAAATVKISDSGRGPGRAYIDGRDNDHGLPRRGLSRPVSKIFPPGPLSCVFFPVDHLSVLNLRSVP